MLYLFIGTDRVKARSEMNKAIAREGKKARVVRITDVSTPADVQEALRGAGMFEEKRIIVFDGVFANDEMRSIVLAALPDIKKSEEPLYILEEKLDAETKKKIEKHAEESKKFDAIKQKERDNIFTLAYALKGGDKKKLWVEYQRALSREEAPEAVHGVLFWGAKDMLLRAKAKSPEWNRGAELVASLAELPHEARRRGFDLEYALERYILSLPAGKASINK